MIVAFRPTLQAFSQLLRTSSLSRSLVILLSGAIVLLMVVNLAVFVMIQRTAAFNDTVERDQDIHLRARRC